MAGSRPFQEAQASLSRWFKTADLRWCAGKKWKELTDAEKIQATAGLLRSKFYKNMRNLDKKKALADKETRHQSLDLTRPWNWLFQAVAADKDFWKTEVKDKAFRRPTKLQV